MGEPWGSGRGISGLSCEGECRLTMWAILRPLQAILPKSP